MQKSDKMSLIGKLHTDALQFGSVGCHLGTCTVIARQ
jgi:hypothetical protein